MNIVRTLARWICTVTFLAAGICALHGMTLLAFIVSGTVVPGERMYMDMAAPSLAGIAEFSAIAFFLAVVLAVLRSKLGATSAKRAPANDSVGA